MSEQYGLEDNKKGQAGKADFRLVEAKDFSQLDIDFYENTTVEFQLSGFSLIGDIEFVCFSEFLPRTFHRTMCSEDGRIVAEFYHEKVQGLDFILGLFFGRCRSHKGICLTTEFCDGDILYTVRAERSRKSIPLPAGITKQIVPTRTRVQDMIEAHKSKLAEYVEQYRSKKVLAIRTFQQWVESLYRVKAYSK
jgi:hypothetical protein